MDGLCVASGINVSASGSRPTSAISWHLDRSISHLSPSTAIYRHLPPSTAIYCHLSLYDIISHKRPSLTLSTSISAFAATTTECSI